MQRRRFKQEVSLNARLEQEAARLRVQAKKLPLGREREELVRKARQAEIATGEAKPEHGYLCEMPYQVGQAAKASSPVQFDWS